MRNLFLAFTLLITGFAINASDLIILKDGNELAGQIKKVKDCQITIKTSHGRYDIPVHEIGYVGFENANNCAAKDLTDFGPLCSQGKLDAIAFHGKRLEHMALGFVFGPLSMIATYAIQPGPRQARKVESNPNKDMFEDFEYLACYRRKATGRLIADEAIGWAAFFVTIIYIGALTDGN